MKKFAKMAVAAAVAGLSFAASAGLLIDDFNTPQAIIADTTSTGGGVASAQAGALTSIIGGQRELFVSKIGAAATNNFSGVQIGVAPAGFLSFASDPGDNGYAVVRWDGSNTSTAAQFEGAANTIGILGPNNIDIDGLGDVDFGSAAVAFKLSVLSSDAGFPFTLNVFSNTGAFTSLTLGALGVPTGTGPVDFIIPFSDFFGADIATQPADPVTGIINRTSFGGGVDFAHIGALEAIINTGGAIADVDIRIDIVQAVPEPESLALVGLGLLGLAAIRRRKSAK